MIVCSKFIIYIITDNANGKNNKNIYKTEKEKCVTSKVLWHEMLKIIERICQNINAKTTYRVSTWISDKNFAQFLNASF